MPLTPRRGQADYLASMQLARSSLSGYNSHMKKATISQAKNKLSQLIDWVKAGETVIITDRSVPVARLEPIGPSRSNDPDGRLERLERQGLITRGRGGGISEKTL